MISKSQIQFIKSLSISKFRKANKMFIAEGTKVVNELANSPYKIEGIYAFGDWIKKNRFRFSKETVFTEVTEKELKRISSLKTPNQVLAVIYVAENDQQLSKSIDKLVLMLDDIRDPGNMGTIIRTADWFGINQIICSNSCVDKYNPKVVQATMGSLFRVQVYYTDLKDYLEQLPKDHSVYGTLLEGENIYQSTMAKHGIIIIGNESHGISDELIPFITNKITIPNYSTKPLDTAESLNASIATAIVCAEFRRQSK